MIECLGRFGFSKVLKKSFNDFFVVGSYCYENLNVSWESFC